ncbi:lipoyl synthase [Thermostichus vulcanus]|uniref:Lipoyl synthase n=1 Tax=Thermostichus vulcanus str. 'Rupite' TaxID=2813851 RepID=A0ABT0CDK7_THEVL|nr:lipoyl synthase [Thermostichus vulcanus]MCJ2543878.1 lipoyl synthase [Thermostichus vulcanus str. 'Rupite']
MPVSPLPSWVKRSIGKASDTSAVQQVIKQRGLHTICEEGRCPNRAECYSQKTATFLLMGGVCTRACSFCQVETGRPGQLDPEEPEKVAEAVQLLGLSYVVLTSVARDDLPDQGSGRFVEVMQAIRQRCPGTDIEVLTPDFRGDRDCIARVVAAQPICYNHNIETVRRLSQAVRRSSGYELSLRVLKTVKELAPNLATKSGLMLGHGETRAEVLETLQDLLAVGCDRLTLGQYLQPSLAHRPVERYWTPAEFVELGQIARQMGFQQVRSGPLVRSSYHAAEMGQD